MVGKLKENETILIIGPTTGVQEQKISSIQISHKQVGEVKKGQSAGIKLNFKARKNDKVY